MTTINRHSIKRENRSRKKQACCYSYKERQCFTLSHLTPQRHITDLGVGRSSLYRGELEGRRPLDSLDFAEWLTKKGILFLYDPGVFAPSSLRAIPCHRRMVPAIAHHCPPLPTMSSSERSRERIGMDRTSIPRPCELAYKCLAHASHSPILEMNFGFIFSRCRGKLGLLTFWPVQTSPYASCLPVNNFLRHGLHSQHRNNIPSPTRLLSNTLPLFGWNKL